jgi:hypothetical protein
MILARVKTDTPAKPGSISFLKKRNKEPMLNLAALKKKIVGPFRGQTRFLFLSAGRLNLIKSFLVLFFKKELLPWMGAL